MPLAGSDHMLAEGRGGQFGGRSEGCERRLPSILSDPSVPSRAEAAQLRLVCPARHPGRWPVPSPPARPPRDHVPSHRAEPLRGPRWGWAVDLGLSFPTPNRVGKGGAGARSLSGGPSTGGVPCLKQVPMSPSTLSPVPAWGKWWPRSQSSSKALAGGRSRPSAGDPVGDP